MPLYDWNKNYTDDPAIHSAAAPYPCKVFDVDTGEEIRWVFWCNTDTGEIERMEVDKFNLPVRDTDGQVSRIREHRRLAVEFTVRREGVKEG